MLTFRDHPPSPSGVRRLLYLRNVPVPFLKDIYQHWFDYYRNFTGIEIKDLHELNDEGLTETDLLTDAEFITP
jgi:hypothetical protein